MRPGTRTIVAVALVFTVIWAGMVVFAGARFLRPFHVGLSSCLPSDFPKYPGASLASLVVSDSLGDCTVQYRTRDSASDVQSFYETSLTQGDWIVTGVDAPRGMITFRRVSAPATVGLVKIYSFPGQQTQFQVQVRKLNLS